MSEPFCEPLAANSQSGARHRRIALSRFCYRCRKTLAPQGPRKLPKLAVFGRPGSAAELPEEYQIVGGYPLDAVGMARHPDLCGAGSRERGLALALFARAELTALERIEHAQHLVERRPADRSFTPTKGVLPSASTMKVARSGTSSSLWTIPSALASSRL